MLQSWTYGQQRYSIKIYQATSSVVEQKKSHSCFKTILLKKHTHYNGALHVRCSGCHSCWKPTAGSGQKMMGFCPSS